MSWGVQRLKIKAGLSDIVAVVRLDGKVEKSLTEVSNQPLKR